MYRLLYDMVLSRTDPEEAHRYSFGALRALTEPGAVRNGVGGAAIADDPVIAQSVFGCRVPSPLGLAAGFDKDARGVDAMACLGFGFVEVGTVTGRPQPGNPEPRLFRLPADRGIINRMGFNNRGSAAAAARLAQRLNSPTSLPVMVGVNIGKTKAVPVDQAIGDYVASARRVAPYADYLVANVSSPNTPGLRDLQAVQSLRPLLTEIAQAADAAAGKQVPLMVKIAPDLADADVQAVGELAGELGLAGVIATNTTLSRQGLRTPRERIDAIGDGGFSGPALARRSLEVLRLLRAGVGDSMLLISVGGVWSAQDVWDRMTEGATLVQGYTGLIYNGPMWPRRVHRDLSLMAKSAGIKHISEIIGTAS